LGSQGEWPYINRSRRRHIAAVVVEINKKGLAATRRNPPSITVAVDRDGTLGELKGQEYEKDNYSHNLHVTTLEQLCLFAMGIYLVEIHPVT
jgi:hypothetical protein